MRLSVYLSASVFKCVNLVFECVNMYSCVFEYDSCAIEYLGMYLSV